MPQPAGADHSRTAASARRREECRSGPTHRGVRRRIHRRHRRSCPINARTDHPTRGRRLCILGPKHARGRKVRPGAGSGRGLRLPSVAQRRCRPRSSWLQSHVERRGTRPGHGRCDARSNERIGDLLGPTALRSTPAQLRARRPDRPTSQGRHFQRKLRPGTRRTRPRDRRHRWSLLPRPCGHRLRAALRPARHTRRTRFTPHRLLREEPNSRQTVSPA